MVLIGAKAEHAWTALSKHRPAPNAVRVWTCPHPVDAAVIPQGVRCCNPAVGSLGVVLVELGLVEEFVDGDGFVA